MGPTLKIDFIRNQSRTILVLETNLQGSGGTGSAFKTPTAKEDSGRGPFNDSLMRKPWLTAL